MTLLRPLVLAAFSAIALTAVAVSETNTQVEARKVALDLAGAFSNDGFKLRDGHWSGEIKKGEQTLLAVNLYAGNHYWFSVGSAPEAKKVSITLYDENGQALTTESYEDEARAAAGFSPTVSGQYFVGISPTEAESGSYCLVYSYR